MPAVCRISESPSDHTYARVNHLNSVLEKALKDNVQAVAEILRLGNDLRSLRTTPRSPQTKDEKPPQQAGRRQSARA